MAGVIERAAVASAALVERAWEAKRVAYALGWRRQQRVGARVVSVGNLSVGGAGKTTLTLHLARLARQRGLAAAVVCRRYRPGRGGRGDEEQMYRAALGAECTFAGRTKRDLAAAAAAAGARWIVVDDGFSHWALARDVDVVLLDATDLWGGGRLLPAGRLREPRRALQRAHAVVISRLPAGAAPGPWFDRVRPFAPAALLAAGRHRVVGVRDSEGRSLAASGAAHVVTATGNPQAVASSAREAGFEPVTLSAYRDHHAFSVGEAMAEQASARGATLLITAKDAVRWPAGAGPLPSVLEVAWEWCAGGEAIERLALGQGA